MSNSKRIKKKAFNIAINEKYRLFLPEIEKIKECYKDLGINPGTLILYGKRIRI